MQSHRILRKHFDRSVRHAQVGPPRDWSAEDIDFVSAVTAMVSLALQESRRARSERLLRESEEKFRALFEGTSQAVALHDESGILEVNPSWFRLLGSSRMDDVVGKHPAELSAPIQPGGERAEAELLRTLAREKELGQLRSNFVSMVSHEFRTPNGYYSILSRNPSGLTRPSGACRTP